MTTSSLSYPGRCPNDGVTRRDAAHALLADRRAVYVRRGQRALLTALLVMDTATADEVRDAVDLPRGMDPVCLGAVPSALARAGIIRRVGYTPTCRPTAHARPVSVWTLADRAKALRWLADHPDLPDPGDDGSPTIRSALFPINPKKEPGETAGTAAPGMEV